MSVRMCIIICLGLACLTSAAPQANNRPKRQRIYFEDELDDIPTPDQGTGSNWDDDDTSRDTRAPHFGPAWNPPTYTHNHFGNWDNAHKFGYGPHKFGWGYDPHDNFHGGSNAYPRPKSRNVPEFGNGPVKEALGREKRQLNRPANNQRPNVSGSWNQNQPSWNEIGNNGNANSGPDWDNFGSLGNANGGAWNGNQRPNNGAWNGDGGAWNGNQNNGAWNQRPNGNQNAWNQNPNVNGNQNNGAWNQRPNGNQNNGAWNQRPSGNPNGGTGSWNANQNNGAWNPNPNGNQNNGAWNSNPNGSGNPSNGAWNGNPSGGSWNNQRPNGNQNGGTGSWNGGNNGSPNAPGNNGNFGNSVDPTNNNNNRPRPGGSSNNRPRPGGSNNQKIRPPITIGGARPPSTPPPNCDCPATSETNPVCGTDGSTYVNLSRLNCARVCGTSAGVQMQHYGACPATTPSPDLRRRG